MVTYRNVNKKSHDNILKSSFVIDTVIYRSLKNYPDKDIKLVYFSLELGATFLLAKIMCLYIYDTFGKVISFTDLMSWQNILSDEDYECVKASRQWLDSVMDKLIIYDKALNAKSFYATMMGLLEEWGDFTESSDGRRTIYTKNNPEQLVLVVIDHVGLCTPSAGSDKKQEIDKISQYCVTLREKCEVSFYLIQQENRNSSNMDRRKADMTECSPEDLKDTGNTYNDSEVCLGIYYPLKHKIKTHRGYPIITEGTGNGFIGLRDRYRNCLLIKNRKGVSDRAIPLNFFGELGLFNQLDKPETINDWSPYLSLTKHLENTDVQENKSSESTLNFNFKF